MVQWHRRLTWFIVKLVVGSSSHLFAWHASSFSSFFVCENRPPQFTLVASHFSRPLGKGLASNLPSVDLAFFGFALAWKACCHSPGSKLVGGFGSPKGNQEAVEARDL